MYQYLNRCLVWMKQERYSLYLDGFAWTSSSLFGKQRISCASGTGYLDSHFFVLFRTLP